MTRRVTRTGVRSQEVKILDSDYSVFIWILNSRFIGVLQNRIELMLQSTS
jgi:hypothetical protein